MFKGGLEKSKQLPPLYEAVAKMGGAEFLNAGSDVSTDGVDGLHLHVRIREKAEATRGFDGHKRDGHLTAPFHAQGAYAKYRAN